MQADACHGDIAESALQNVIADYDPCDLKAITPGI